MRRFLIAFIIAFIAGRAAASFPLEEQRIAAVMQTRLQDSLDRLFGAGRSAAAVSVTLATDPRVARRIEEALGGAKLGPSGRYEWTWGTNKSQRSRYVLPGLPDASTPKIQPGNLRMESAAALSKRTARLSVTVLLDETLPEDADGRATELVARTIEFNESRGDLLEVKRTPMPQPVQAPSGPVSSFFLWCCLLVFIAACAGVFWFVDRWMRTGGRPPSPEPKQLPAPPPPREPPPPLSDDVLSRVRAPFQIRSEDASKLFFILRKESSEDIALVLPHLLPPTRKALLAYFSEDEAARAIEASTRFRVVDPELIVLLKGELERRVSALHGGPDVAAGILDDADPQDRARIVSALERFEPAIAETLKGSNSPATQEVDPTTFDDLTVEPTSTETENTSPKAESDSFVDIMAPPDAEPEQPEDKTVKLESASFEEMMEAPKPETSQPVSFEGMGKIDVFDDTAPPPSEKKPDDEKDDDPPSGGGSTPFPDGSGTPPTPQLFLDEDPK